MPSKVSSGNRFKRFACFNLCLSSIDLPKLYKIQCIFNCWKFMWGIAKKNSLCFNIDSTTESRFKMTRNICYSQMAKATGYASKFHSSRHLFHSFVHNSRRCHALMCLLLCSHAVRLVLLKHDVLCASVFFFLFCLLFVVAGVQSKKVNKPWENSFKHNRSEKNDDK